MVINVKMIAILTCDFTHACWLFQFAISQIYFDDPVRKTFMEKSQNAQNQLRLKSYDFFYLCSGIFKVD